MILTDMIVSAIVKRGILAEFRNFETEVDIPSEEKLLRVSIKAETLTIRIEKE